MKRLALALATLLLAASVVGVSTPATAAPADSLYSLVNQERAAKGLPALVRNASIEAVAVNWANQMAANGKMQHNPNYSSQIPGGWTAAAENVAQGQPTAAQMNSDWMNSPGHRANVLGDYTHVGIGAQREPQSRLWVTLVFMKTNVPGIERTLGPFVDDDFHTHEQGISRVAAAGITVGWDWMGRRFCAVVPAATCAQGESRALSRPQG